MSLPEGQVYATTLRPGDVVIDPHGDKRLTIASVARQNQAEVRVMTEESNLPYRWHKFLGVTIVDSA